MSRHDDIMRGLGLHGQAIVATVEMLVDLRARQPDLDQIARRIDTTPAALRCMFPDIDRLLIAVAEQALVHLIDSCTKAVVKVDPDDPLGQFLALGGAYIRWAATHQVEFRLITSHPSLDAMQIPELRRYLDSMTDLMMRMLIRARGDGLLRKDEDIPMIVLSSRAFSYGLAQMVVDGRMVGMLPSDDPIEAAEASMADFLRRLTTTPAKRPARRSGSR